MKREDELLEEYRIIYGFIFLSDKDIETLKSSHEFRAYVCSERWDELKKSYMEYVETAIKLFKIIFKRFTNK